jgi:spore coat protein SA
MHNSHLLEASREEIREITGIDAMFCSRFLMDEATTLWTDLRKTAVIYNGADEKLFYPATNKIEWEEAGRAPIVLFVGRLVPEKGAHVLIEAVEQLQRTGQKVHAEIVGAAGFGAGKHSEYSAGLLSRASESITFPGYLSGEGLAKKYRSSDIFCCPSIWNEPLGMINLEAMASGLPVVAARVGGIPEVLAGGGGVLVNPDDASGLAAALERMIREREFRIKCAGEAYESFKKQFSWSVVQERYREVLQQVETRN